MVINPTRLRFWNGCLQHQPVATFMMRLQITRLPNGHYLATSQDVPGLVAQGKTESEAVTIAQRWPENWTKSPHWHVCTDPSHPALVQFPGQKGLYRQVLEKVEALVRSGAQDADVTSQCIPGSRRGRGRPQRGRETDPCRRTTDRGRTIRFRASISRRRAPSHRRRAGMAGRGGS